MKDKQINVKLTKQDIQDIEIINKRFFEGEASGSMLVRILVREGIKAFNEKK